MGKATDSIRKRKALDRNLNRLKPLLAQMPSDGWIRTIRESLRMTQSQLASQLGVSQPAIKAIEASETKGRVQLDSMKRVADALNCDFVYALVPRRPLDEIVRSRAVEIAKEQMASVNQSMLIENQLPTTGEEALNDLVNFILNQDVPLWENFDAFGK